MLSEVRVFALFLLNCRLFGDGNLGQQRVPDMSVYQFSSKEKGPFTSTMLRENLLKLIQAADTEASSSSSSSLTGKVVKHRFQDAKGKVKYFKGITV